MKKVLTVVMVFMMIITMTGNSFATCGGTVYFDVIDGQKVLIGEPEDIVAYLSTLNRQQLLDLAIVDRGNGQFYARGLSGDHVLTWKNGKDVTAYDLTPDMDEYQVLANNYMLVADSQGKVATSVLQTILPLDNIGYPYLVYSPADNALIEEYTLAESYPGCECFDTFSVKNGFENQEMFMALKTWYRWSERRQRTEIFEAWQIISLADIILIQAPWIEPYEPDKEPDKDPGKEPDKDHDSEPENNPRPTTRPTVPENNPRPTPGVPTGDGEPSNDPDPFNGGNTGSGDVSHDPDPFNGGNNSHTGSGNVSNDPDPMNGGNSGSPSNSHTGTGNVSHDADPMTGGNGGSDNNSKPSSHTGSGSISQDRDPMSSGNAGSSNSSSSTHTISHDTDPMSSGGRSDHSSGSSAESSSRPDSSSSSSSESSSRPSSSSSSSYSESSSRPSSSSSSSSSESSSRSSESTGSGSASHDADPFG